MAAVVVIGYLAFRAGAGHTRHRYQKARGLPPNLYIVFDTGAGTR